MKDCFFILFFYGWGFGAFAQNVGLPLSTKYSQVNAFSANQADVFSFTGNVAALATIQTTGIGFFTERRFLLNELNHSVAAACIKTENGGFGLRLGYSGFKEYNEMNAGLSYGRQLGTKLDLGLGFVYYNMRISSYGNTSGLAIEVGSLWHIAENIRTGFRICQPVHSEWPFIYRFGIGYDPSAKIFVGISIEKQERQTADILAGFQYKLTSQFSARAGVSTSPGSGWLGIGFSWKKTQFNFTINYHPQLGVTPGLYVGLSFKEN